MAARQREETSTMAAVRLQERGQFTIPAKVRKAAGLRSGDTLVVRVTGPGRLEVVAVPTRPVDDFFKEARRELASHGPIDLEQVREAMGREMAAEYRTAVEPPPPAPGGGPRS